MFAIIISESLFHVCYNNKKNARNMKTTNSHDVKCSPGKPDLLFLMIIIVAAV